MSVYKLFPIGDATLYSQFPYQNTGLDEIIELSLQNNEVIVTGNNTITHPETSRILIKFSSSSIQDIINNKISGSTWRTYLKLWLAEASNIPADFTIDCFPISGGWTIGTGHFSDIPETQNGVSWTYRTANSESWQIGGFNSGTTGSFSGSNSGGGVWYTASMASQSFNNISSKDIELDVTNIVNQFYSGTISNQGFILKQRNEFITSSIFDFKFFSMDTHTIYPPQLEFRWADASFVTGSGSVVSNNQIVLSLGNNKGEYQQETIQRFNIYVRDKFPARQFITSSVYLNNKFLPSRSYWSLKDLHTEEIVIPFDTGSTVISCDGTSSYFKIFMDGLEPERFYRVLIKTVVGSETLVFDDESFTFKVKK